MLTFNHGENRESETFISYNLKGTASAVLQWLLIKTGVHSCNPVQSNPQMDPIHFQLLFFAFTVPSSFLAVRREVWRNKCCQRHRNLLVVSSTASLCSLFASCSRQFSSIRSASLSRRSSSNSSCVLFTPICCFDRTVLPVFVWMLIPDGNWIGSMDWIGWDDR